MHGRCVAAGGAAHDAAMVEYGNGVGQATGVAGGSHGGGSMDAGAAIGHVVDNALHTVQTMPPAQLAFLVIAIVIGLVLFKRAF